MNFWRIRRLSFWRSVCIFLGAVGFTLYCSSTEVRAGTEPHGTKEISVGPVLLEHVAPVGTQELAQTRGKQLKGSAPYQDPWSVAVILWDEMKTNRYPTSVSSNTAVGATVNNTFSATGGVAR